jgi:hypothetical protein
MDVQAEAWDFLRARELVEDGDAATASGGFAFCSAAACSPAVCSRRDLLHQECCFV